MAEETRRAEEDEHKERMSTPTPAERSDGINGRRGECRVPSESGSLRISYRRDLIRSSRLLLQIFHDRIRQLATTCSGHCRNKEVSAFPSQIPDELLANLVPVLRVQ